ncbi:MAG: TRAP transporter small permease [Actinobacteria bacterium]|jgi:TRAP-type C4-dicarboxylate transport system permease small subunit|nr:TRAP transporter small permease [Actinomycetota bacterium]
MLNFFKLIEAFNDKVIQFFKYLASLLLVVVGLLILSDVLLRGVFNKPLIGVPEIIANLVVIIAFFQFAYAASIESMLRSDFTIEKAGPKMKKFLDLLSCFLGLIFFVLLATSSYSSMIKSIISSEFEGHASFRFPTSPLKSTIFIFSCITAFTYLLLFISKFFNLKK